MDVLPKRARLSALAIIALAVLPTSVGAQTATVQRLALVNSPSGVEIEITCTAPITPQTQLVQNPERLVVDFPQAAPAVNLRNLVVNRAEVKGVRVGLFAANPPVTRIVLDLNGPQSYEVLPSGNQILIKIGESGTVQSARITPVNFAPASPPVVPLTPPAPKVMVRFQSGLLTIRAERASLAEVLVEVQRRIGADIPIPAGADQEQVVVNVGPLPAEAALASLFNGSRFNFILVGSAENSAAIRSVLLTPKSGLPLGEVISSAPAVAQSPPGVAVVNSAPAQTADSDDDDEDADDPAEAPPPQGQPQPH